MKKIMIILAMLIMSMAGTTYAKVVRNGNTFENVNTQKQDKQTPYTYKDKDGMIHPIYITSKGACYIKRISKKTGREYKYYLPKEVQNQIKKELHVTEII